MTKLELKEMIREVLKEELHKTNNTKEVREDLNAGTAIIMSDALGEKITVDKNDVTLIKEIDQKVRDIWTDAINRGQDEDSLCDEYGISSFSGVELFDKFTSEAGITWDLVEHEACDSEELKEDATSGTMDWEELIAEADHLLDELAKASGNTNSDDGDGYWAGEEGHVWCNRNLYYTDKLNNTNKLEKLCDEYSKKLPNVEFYYYEDDLLDDPVSEIGYNATNPDFEEDDWNM